MFYVICPLDFDFIPILGWADDFFVAYMGIKKWRDGTRMQQEAKARFMALQHEIGDRHVRPHVHSADDSNVIDVKAGGQ